MKDKHELEQALIQGSAEYAYDCEDKNFECVVKIKVEDGLADATIIDGFTLTAEEVDVTEVVFNTFILDRSDLRKFIAEHNKEFNIINNLLTRIKQWQEVQK